MFDFVETVSIMLKEDKLQCDESDSYIKKVELSHILHLCKEKCCHHH